MKIFFKAAFSFLLSLVIAVACGCTGGANRNEVSDNVDIAADSLRANASANRDEEFVEDLLEENVQLTSILQDGANMGTDAGLKREAKAMHADHVALGTRLRELARSKGFETEDVSSADSSMQRSTSQRGRDWDVDWTGVIEDRHQKMMNRLDDYSDDTKDADILAFINDARPKLAKHLESAEATKTRLKN